MKKMSWCKLRVLRRHLTTTSCYCSTSKPRVNPVKIQLLSETLHRQIFRRNGTPLSAADVTADANVEVRGQQHTGSEGFSRVTEQEREMRKLKRIQEHLQSHELWDKTLALEKDVNFGLPPFLGNDIGEHFTCLATRQIEDYVELATRLDTCTLPPPPATWAYVTGWTKYNHDGTTSLVDYPEEKAIVFDVETVVKEGNYPTMATAVSDQHWYSWCSESLVADKYQWSQGKHLDDLIPLETTPGSSQTGSGQPHLVIGHNVAFDRSFVQEQYYIKKSRLRFLDTMSLHIAVCGLTNFQRVLYKAAQNNSKQKVVLEYRKRQRERGAVTADDWKEVSTLNNLRDVHQLHVGGAPVDKDPRNVFVEGSMEDVRENFQSLMKYCSDDVLATYRVFKVLWREFNERFPHPVTLAGMLEMGTGYLPINQNWDRYVHQSNAVYEDMQRESKQILIGLANDACQYLKNDRYKDDPWLWDLDWTTKDMKIKKKKHLTKKELKAASEKLAEMGGVEAVEETDKTSEEILEEILKHQERHFKVSQTQVGYPEWYRGLCHRLSDEDWSPGPSGISSQTRVTPKLLRLTWDGYPLHYDVTHGWGYLVPGRKDNLGTRVEAADGKFKEFPYRRLCEMLNFDPDGGAVASEDADGGTEMSDEQFESMMDSRLRYDDLPIDEVKKHFDDTGIHERRRMKKGSPKPSKKGSPQHVGDGPYDSVNIPGCWFYKIPHKDGQGKRVGNPLAKDYQNRVEDGTLKALAGLGAEQVLKLNKACSYWKNNQKRIESQMIVWLNDSELNEVVKSDPGYTPGQSLGAIVPRIIPAGTITRRAVEPTWLTASNAYADRIGSELKSMIQSPPGYSFVGADVDSQELWIGAILGDAHFGQTHGCTALGWMTLQGNKKEKTDLHSKVAETVDISRDHAKIFNYGRIYGAGQKFAEKLLLQFNHRMTVEEAKKKAALMFSTTKGKRSYRTGKWQGGSESAMFNKLEEIARMEHPSTPVLGCRISKALEPENVHEDFMTSRINWVVQSSAVDYLHLMLVCMRWLFDVYEIDGRFCISIHDEVRYLVAKEDQYRAALALQVTNLLTRSMFAQKLGIYDLPQSVAFFSAVDIDRCLRKEVTLHCDTPSNPHGMESGYQIPDGEALDIHQILEKTQGSLERRTK